MAKRDFTKREALLAAWRAASLADREWFAAMINREVYALFEQAFEKLYPSPPADNADSQYPR